MYNNRVVLIGHFSKLIENVIVFFSAIWDWNYRMLIFVCTFFFFLISVLRRIHYLKLIQLVYSATISHVKINYRFVAEFKPSE